MSTIRRSIPVALAALVYAGAALAADRARIRFNAADQAAARAAVLQAADFAQAKGWTGGRTKPQLTSGLTCANFRPKQSDLVLTGAAASQYQHRSGFAFQSVAHVLRTRQMVRLDWKRSVDNPALLPCLRSTFEKNAKAQNLRIVSVRRVSFPRLATFSAAYRVEIEVRPGGRRIRMLSDIVLLGRGRTELTLTATAPSASRATVEAAEIRLARRLVARIRA